MTDQPWTMGRSKWDLDTPSLMVDLDVLDRNVARMATTFKQAGVGWRPHTKGIKVPALAHKLLRAGAFGITCAKLGEAEVMAAAGVGDILIANQVVGGPKIARLVNLIPWADVIVAVDDESNVRELERAAADKGVRPRIVVEVNTGMNRAGVEPGQATVALARCVDACEHLRFVGVMGWEGHSVTVGNAAEKRAIVQRAVGQLVDSAERCRDAGLPVAIVSCGGTGDYAMASGIPGVTEVQAGGGIFCDVHYREHMHVDHEYASTVLATVTSRPTPTRIICDTGKKTMSTDAAAPKPLIDGTVQALSFSAEHARIDVAEPSALRVGDKIEFVVGYTDTTTMLHDEMFGVRDGRVETVWPILGRGKLR